MRKLLILLGIVSFAFSCNQPSASTTASNASFDSLLDTYYEERLKLYPLEGTFVGDKRYNDTIVNDGSQAFFTSLKSLCDDYFVKLETFKDAKLSDDQKLSFDILNYQLTTLKEGFHLGLYYDAILAEKDQGYFTFQYLTPKRLILPPEWNLSFCTKPSRVITTRSP